ncbi:hypothetical protein GCM10010178_89900 [Lentzea flava]|uniref:histidine kinase n=1 Tax=Lentzea flava TaxID=103732 RepID=A0ABQ2VGX3_9PSEU|nr:His Kinase A (phospho-acceptor) domain-containing protein [Lentzea flava]GGU85794.1 hypothetical protein GCM10010178_89900 [Lentzea flava]
MLARLERSFTSQRRFLTNAAHELKTPVATQRTLIEVAPAHPTAGGDGMALGRRLLDGLDHQQRLITGLLALAQDSGTICRDELVDLGRAVHDALENRLALATERVELLLDLNVGKVRGDSVLLGQSVHNLVDNAIVHNVPGGWVSARTDSDGTTSLMEIVNGGPRVDRRSGGPAFRTVPQIVLRPGGSAARQRARSLGRAGDRRSTRRFRHRPPTSGGRPGCAGRSTRSGSRWLLDRMKSAVNSWALRIHRRSLQVCQGTGGWHPRRGRRHGAKSR